MGYEEEGKPLNLELIDCEPGPGRVLVKPFQRSSSGGGILLAEGVLHSPYRAGRVVKVGPLMQMEFGEGREESRCDEGNTILYDTTRAPLVAVNVAGVEHHLIRQIQVLGRCKVADKMYDVPAPPVKLALASERGLEAVLPSPIRAVE